MFERHVLPDDVGVGHRLVDVLDVARDAGLLEVDDVARLALVLEIDRKDAVGREPCFRHLVLRVGVGREAKRQLKVGLARLAAVLFAGAEALQVDAGTLAEEVAELGGHLCDHVPDPSSQTGGTGRRRR